jgi:hypothetical protein
MRKKAGVGKSLRLPTASSCSGGDADVFIVRPSIGAVLYRAIRRSESLTSGIGVAANDGVFGTENRLRAEGVPDEVASVVPHKVS